MKDLINKIVEKTDFDEEEVEEKIKEKVEEFSGLVSDDGAVHLVAKELDVELPKVESKSLKVKNIIPGMRKVNLKAKVVDIGDINQFEKDDGDEGTVQNIIIGDETGTVPLVLWNEQTELSDKLDDGEAIAIKDAFSRKGLRGRTELRINNSSKVKRIDSEAIPEVKQGNISGNHSKVNLLGIKDEGQRYEITGTIVQIYTRNPFFQVCPECEKKVNEDEGKWVCDDHGEVEPKYALVLSGIVDDGFSNIRCVFFRNVARKLINIDDKKLSEDIVEEKAKEALGQEIKIKGRASYNDYFNRIELMANEVKFPNVKKLIKIKNQN